MRTPYHRGRVLNMINDERDRQRKKWGEQSHPFHRGDPKSYAVQADWFKANGNNDAWDFILLEEVYEALTETDEDLILEEIVQVCAVGVAMAEDILRKRDKV